MAVGAAAADPVALDTSGEFRADLAGYLRDHAAGGYPVADVTESVCTPCGGRRFRVLADDDAASTSCSALTNRPA
ncbi:hypothetical protein JCM33774_18750 [Actinophytocola sp. KF-1]